MVRPYSPTCLLGVSTEAVLSMLIPTEMIGDGNGNGMLSFECHNQKRRGSDHLRQAANSIGLAISRSTPPSRRNSNVGLDKGTAPSLYLLQHLKGHGTDVYCHGMT